jgi:hypothetical protein
VQFGIAVAVVGQFPAPQPPVARFHGSQGTDAVPLDLEDMMEKARADSRLRVDKPAPLLPCVIIGYTSSRSLECPP